MTEELQTEINKVRGPHGALYDLLTKKLPAYRSSRGRSKLGIYELANAMGVSHQHIYQFLPSGTKPAKNNLSIKMARKLIECSENQLADKVPKDFKPLTLLDLEPFLPS